MASTKGKTKGNEQADTRIMPPLPRYPEGLFKQGMQQRKLKQYWREYFEKLFDWQIQNNIPLPPHYEKQEDYASSMASLAVDFQKYHYSSAIDGLLQLMIFEVLSYTITFMGMLSGAEDYEIKEAWPRREDLEGLLLFRFGNHLDNLPVRPTRGGNRRSKENLTNWKKQTFTHRVATVMPLWKHIISMLEKHEYEEDVWDFIKGRNKFQSLCKDCYVDLNDPILEQLAQEATKKRKRYWSKSQSIPENLSAKAFAMYQAAMDVGIKGSYWVLEKIASSNRLSEDRITIKAGKNDEHRVYLIFMENPQAASSNDEKDPKAWDEEMKKIEEQRRRRYLTAMPTKKK